MIRDFENFGGKEKLRMRLSDYGCHDCKLLTCITTYTILRELKIYVSKGRFFLRHNKWVVPGFSQLNLCSQLVNLDECYKQSSHPDEANTRVCSSFISSFRGHVTLTRIFGNPLGTENNVARSNAIYSRADLLSTLGGVQPVLGWSCTSCQMWLFKNRAPKRCRVE